MITATTALIEAFGRGPAPKEELGGTEVVSLSHAELGKREIPALDDVGAVVTMGHEAFVSVVEWLNKGAALRGVVAMVEEYDARSIEPDPQSGLSRPGRRDATPGCH